MPRIVIKDHPLPPNPMLPGKGWSPCRFTVVEYAPAVRSIRLVGGRRNVVLSFPYLVFLLIDFGKSDRSFLSTNYYPFLTFRKTPLNAARFLEEEYIFPTLSNCYWPTGQFCGIGPLKSATRAIEAFWGSRFNPGDGGQGDAALHSSSLRTYQNWEAETIKNPQFILDAKFEFGVPQKYGMHAYIAVLNSIDPTYLVDRQVDVLKDE